MKRRPSGNIWVGIFGLMLLVLAVLGLWQHQFIADWARAYQFTPDAKVAMIAEDTAMSERGRMLFYASQPVLQPAKDFNQSCDGVEKSAAVLGCYANRQIYIYNIDNSELAGIEEVTAAHEMLHAAYDRLSATKRRDVDRMLDIASEDLRGNDVLQDRLKAYDFSSPHERYTELHSIIGTEIADLRPDLEQHYARYFDDRSRVVALHSQYSGVFTKYRQRAEQLAGTLDQRAIDINQANSSYTQAVEALNRDVNQFNQRARSSGGFASQAEFDQARAALASRQTVLEQRRQSLTDMINHYNSLLEEYNGIARHITSLSNSIDSRVAPAPEVE